MNDGCWGNVCLVFAYDNVTRSLVSASQEGIWWVTVSQASQGVHHNARIALTREASIVVQHGFPGEPSRLPGQHSLSQGNDQRSNASRRRPSAQPRGTPPASPAGVEKYRATVNSRACLWVCVCLAQMGILFIFVPTSLNVEEGGSEHISFEARKSRCRVHPRG